MDGVQTALNTEHYEQVNDAGHVGNTSIYMSQMAHWPDQFL